MRVLVLTPELPYAPGGSGGSTRQFHLLRRLVERGWEVDCVAPVHPDQVAGAEILRGAGVRLHAVERPAGRVGEVLAAVRARPALLARAMTEPLLAWQVDVFWTALRPLAERVLRDTPPDVLLVEHDWAAGWARDLGAPRVPRALTLHNLSWAYYAARARAASGAAATGLRVEARRFARFDRARLDDHGLLLAMSAADRAAVAQVTDTPCAVIPNGVDTAAMTLGDPPAAPRALFTGTLSYPPNAEALLWLLRDIWPAVRRAVPDAELTVVGRGAPDEAAALADDSVRLAGWVDDIVPEYEHASVILAPMLSGGGTRLKILDALASARPLVTTTAGAEGVELVPGEHALVADGAAAFAEATVRAFADRTTGARGRELAVARYDWAAIGDALHEQLVQLAS